jgi:hypothetical protein
MKGSGVRVPASALEVWALAQAGVNAGVNTPAREGLAHPPFRQVGTPRASRPHRTRTDGSGGRRAYGAT